MVKNNIDWSKKRVVIVYHDSVFGPPHELRDYLRKKSADSVLCIGHANRYLENNPVKSSYYELYRRKVLVERHDSRIINLPEFLQYTKDFFQTIFWFLTKQKKADYFVGLGNLNAAAGLILRLFGLVDKVIYYVIDYVPKRYSNSIMNSLYHVIDYLCVRFCDFTWNYSEIMIKERSSKWHTTFLNQQVVPNGIHIRKALIQPFSKIHPYELIFLGSLSKEQGVQLAIESMPGIVKKFPSARLYIIGQGYYRKMLEELVKKLHVSKYVDFLGYIADPVKVDKRLAFSSLGIAPYRVDHTLVFHTEPGKIKRYLSCGVPVVMTHVGKISEEIINHHCGFITPYSVKEFSKIVMDYFSKINQMQKYRGNAVRYAAGYQWENIFNQAFKH